MNAKVIIDHESLFLDAFLILIAITRNNVITYGKSLDLRSNLQFMLMVDFLINVKNGKHEKYGVFRFDRMVSVFKL